MLVCKLEAPETLNLTLTHGGIQGLRSSRSGPPGGTDEIFWALVWALGAGHGEMPGPADYGSTRHGSPFSSLQDPPRWWPAGDQKDLHVRNSGEACALTEKLTYSSGRAFQVPPLQSYGFELCGGLVRPAKYMPDAGPASGVV